MFMCDPPHAIEFIKNYELYPLHVTANEAVKAIGDTRKTFSALVNGREATTAWVDQMVNQNDQE